jgi:hypothetical protein
LLVAVVVVVQRLGQQLFGLAVVAVLEDFASALVLL